MTAILYNKLCIYCGIDDNYIYSIDDVQPLCRSCNSKKGDKIL